MKKFLLAIFLVTIISSGAWAQRSTHFGISIQSGNYLQARHASEASAYESTDYRLYRGQLAGLGVYMERSLGRHAGIYTGLDIFHSGFKERLTVESGYTKKERDDNEYKQIVRFTVNQVALPLRLALSTGKRRPLVFSFGPAPALALAKVQATPESISQAYGFFCGDVSFDNNSEKPSVKFQVLFAAGLSYRPDAQNSIGLEYWLAPNFQSPDPPPYIGYGYDKDLYGKNYRMRSLQLCLRHSW